MSNESAGSAAGDEVYGKPFHGWSCDCDECRSYDERGEPRPGEAPKVSAARRPGAPCPDCGHQPDTPNHHYGCKSGAPRLHRHLIGRHVHPGWHGHCDPAKRGYRPCNKPHWHFLWRHAHA